MPSKPNPLSPDEKELLGAQMEAEGFEYYMLRHGPDLELIERLGFDREKVQEAIDVLNAIQEAMEE